MRSSLLARFVIMLALALSLLAGSNAGYAQGNSSGDETRPRFVPGQILVQFEAGASESARKDARAKAGLSKQRGLKSLPGGRASGLELAAIRSGRSVAAAIRALETHPAVAFAEPNWIYTQQATSDDPYYTNGSLWGMYGNATTPANQYGSQAGEAWARGATGSKDVVVAVIDEGMDYNHEDLVANKWTNPGESGLDDSGANKATNGIDDDRNGYTDDIHGWDFQNNNKTCYDGNSTNQGEKHGTHVAGTIGAAGGNSKGVAGVSWSITVICGKFLGKYGGTTADAVEAVSYFTDLKSRHELNLVALNNSWGGGGYSQALHDAIIRAAKADILFVAAAGNDGSNNDKTAHYPSNYDTTKGTSTQSAASYDAVIAVAAIASDGSKPSWSNFGPRTVDLGAPGAGIWSTLPSYLSTPYGSLSGTSMATPHVTGGVALYASTHPTATAEQIRKAVFNSTIRTGSMFRKTVTGGRLDVSGF